MRGKLWTSEAGVACLEEVSAAMRLDGPCPLGARILLGPVQRPVASGSAASSASALSAVSCLGLLQEVVQAAVER